MDACPDNFQAGQWEGWARVNCVAAKIRRQVRPLQPRTGCSPRSIHDRGAAFQRSNGGSATAPACIWQHWGAVLSGWPGMQPLWPCIWGEWTADANHCFQTTCNVAGPHLSRCRLALQSPNEDQAIAAVHLAVKKYGLNFFDVAPFYAGGDAERVRISHPRAA